MFFRRKKTSLEIQAEENIIRKAKKDPEVFGFLYEKYYPEIFVFIERRTDDRQTASDLTSQVFLKALLNLEKYKFKGLPFSSWLYRIATNQVNEHYRNSKKQRVISLEDSHVHSLFEEIESFDFQEDKTNILIEVLDELNEEEILLLELRFFEERPFKEIALILEITENNAKTKTYRLLTKMRNLVKLKPQKL